MPASLETRPRVAGAFHGYADNRLCQLQYHDRVSGVWKCDFHTFTLISLTLNKLSDMYTTFKQQCPMTMYTSAQQVSQKQARTCTPPQAMYFSLTSFRCRWTKAHQLSLTTRSSLCAIAAPVWKTGVGDVLLFSVVSRRQSCHISGYLQCAYIVIKL